MDGVTKQIGLPDTYVITYFVKWVCLHYTISLSLNFQLFKAKTWFSKSSLYTIPEISGYHSERFFLKWVIEIKTVKFVGSNQIVHKMYIHD